MTDSARTTAAFHARTTAIRYHLLAGTAAAGNSFPALQDLAMQADAAGWCSLTLQGAHDSITLLAALSQVTQRIGLVASVDPLATTPYTAARRLASLDHVSNGRSGWILTGAAAPAQALDFVNAMRALWDSWPAQAHLVDKANGRYLDISAIRRVDYNGSHYRSAGPLDIPRPPQGHPVQYGHHPATQPDLLIVKDTPAAPSSPGAVFARLRPVHGHPDTTPVWTADDLRHDIVFTLEPGQTCPELPTNAADNPPGSSLREKLGLAQPATRQEQAS